jgi:hypothetical protein
MRIKSVMKRSGRKKTLLIKTLLEKKYQAQALDNNLLSKHQGQQKLPRKEKRKDEKNLALFSQKDSSWELKE